MQALYDQGVDHKTSSFDNKKNNKKMTHNNADSNVRSLCTVAVNKNIVMVKSLLAQGAILDHADEMGHTALFYAVQRCDNIAVVQYLLDKGANVNLKNVNNSNPVLLACSHSRTNTDNVVALLRMEPEKKILRQCLNPFGGGWSVLAQAMESAPDECAEPSNFLPLIRAALDGKLFSCDGVCDGGIPCYKNITSSGITMMKCPCRTVMYCSKKCQLKSWKAHKQVCPGKHDESNAKTQAIKKFKRKKKTME